MIDRNQTEEATSKNVIIRTQQRVYEMFQKELQTTYLRDREQIIIRINNFDQLGPRLMFYDFKEPFFDVLREKLKRDLSNILISATDVNVIVQDQEDVYCAIIKHARAANESKEMQIFLERF